jgi:hypothetical protein
VLASIDVSLEAFLRAAAPLSAVDIDVSFDVPNEEWAAKLTRPTVNVHLWDIRRSSVRAVTGVENFERDGINMRRLALPRVELHYFVSVWTSEHEDERTLTSALMVALLAHGEIPTSFLPESLTSLPNPQLQLARSTDTDVFTLGFRTKLGLQLLVVAVVDTGAGIPFAPAVGDVSLGTENTRSEDARSQPNRRIAGEVRGVDATGKPVRSPRGVSVVNESGRFLITAREGDTITVETDPPLTAVVPAIGGVVVEG